MSMSLRGLMGSGGHGIMSGGIFALFQTLSGV